ncbi:MAG: site-specific integrase [Nanohaloarchaea archaeon]|nr:site-specific integrase [Candidatus Nanohaloarchaea archaeon]
MSEIYNRNSDLNGQVQNIKDGNYSRSNKEAILDFKDYLMAQGLSTSRICRYMTTFNTLESIVDFELKEAERSDIISLVGKINQDRINKKDYSPHTLAEYKKAIKKFYSWHKGTQNPEITDFVTVMVKKNEQSFTDPDELPCPEQVKKLQEHAVNPRDKAFISVLWETGGRISEVLHIKWKDLQSVEKGHKIRFTNSKTIKRKVPVKESVKHLKKWQKEHPNASRDSYIFTKLNKNDIITYQGMRNQMEDILDRSGGIECKTNFHAFRKGRATYLAKKGLNQPQICQFFGWVQGSKHARKYIRMANSDLDEAMNKLWSQEEEIKA